MSKKKKIIFASACVLLLLITGGLITGWHYGVKVPREESAKALEETVSECNKAVDSFNISADSYNKKVKEFESEDKKLDDEIKKAQALIDGNLEPYDMSAKDDLIASLKSANEKRVDVPAQIEIMDAISTDISADNSNKEEIDDENEKIMSETSEILSRADKLVADIKELKKPDYSQTLSDLKDKSDAFNKSVTILKQVTAPDEDWVMERLKKVKGIMDMAPVTEDNDPNGNLNKAGGYTSTVYFSYDQVDRSELYIADGKDNVIDIGTAGGGAIEVYENKEFAERRNNYLAGFDGAGIFDSGSHTVVGTIVVRTSDKLKASQQKKLEEAIIEAFTAV